MRHIAVYVSSHGYGHFGQTAPVINELCRRFPALQVTLITALPLTLLQSRLRYPFSHIVRATDFGMRMVSAFTVDLDASYRDYCDFHDRWNELLDKEIVFLRELNPDLVYVNVAYLPLVAAQRVGIPSVALCSLNWADIFYSYFAQRERGVEIYEAMIASYNLARVFLCPQPSMAMTAFSNVRSIGPIAMLGRNRRDELINTFQLDASSRLILVVPGGIATKIPLAMWPRIDGVVYVLTWQESFHREDMIHQRDINMPFADILCSADAVVTKPGYGMVAETACNDVPVLYATRGDWAEEPFLVSWWRTHARIKEITNEQLMTGAFQKEFMELAYLPSYSRPGPSGVVEAVEIIESITG